MGIIVEVESKKWSMIVFLKKRFRLDLNIVNSPQPSAQQVPQAFLEV